MGVRGRRSSRGGELSWLRKWGRDRGREEKKRVGIERIGIRRGGKGEEEERKRGREKRRKGKKGREKRRQIRERGRGR